TISRLGPRFASLRRRTTRRRRREDKVTQKLFLVASFRIGHQQTVEMEKFIVPVALYFFFNLFMISSGQTPATVDCSALNTSEACCSAGNGLDCEFFSCSDDNSTGVAAPAGCLANALDCEGGSSTTYNYTAVTPLQNCSSLTRGPEKRGSGGTSPGTSTGAPATPTAAPHSGGSGSGQSFDAASFIGGIVLCAGLVAIGYFGLKFYRARQDRNYHTL
ncbi:hypothetical protein BaRGS_00015724, partial [Batillaria attramentaria]